MHANHGDIMLNFVKDIRQPLPTVSEAQPTINLSQVKTILLYILKGQL
jgi:hypothetical protein